MRKPQPLRRSLWRQCKDHMHRAQAAASRFYGRPRGGILTDLTLNGQPVIFLHNPKAGGTSLGKFFHVKRLSHAVPGEILREDSWLKCFSIVVVRDPFDRFLSSYYGNVMRGNQNSLTKRYGPIIHDLTPFEFLELLGENLNTGPQTNWTDYPSTRKPQADLILKFEELSGWKQTLLDLGLKVQDRELLHHNKSDRASANHLERLKLSAEEFDRLRARVRVVYARDYELFGYA